MPIGLAGIYSALQLIWMLAGDRRPTGEANEADERTDGDCRLMALLGVPAVALAGGHSRTSSGVHYSGAKHSESHEGHYQNGSGSSHKGDAYRHSRTGNHYGKHGH